MSSGRLQSPPRAASSDTGHRKDSAKFAAPVAPCPFVDSVGRVTADAADRTTDVAIPAATVVLLRDSPRGVETLMLRRDANLEFAGGMWVFPGGRVDPGDYPPGADPASADDDTALDAARQAAVRETDEEAGLTIDAAALVWFAHWTPSGAVARRFATWFFAARAPHGAVVIDNGEIRDHEWVLPLDVIERHRVGAAQLLPPTWMTLTALRRGGSVDEILTRFERRAAVPLRDQDRSRRTTAAPWRCGQATPATTPATPTSRARATGSGCATAPGSSSGPGPDGSGDGDAAVAVAVPLPRFERTRLLVCSSTLLAQPADARPDPLWRGSRAPTEPSLRPAPVRARTCRGRAGSWCSRRRVGLLAVACSSGGGDDNAATSGTPGTESSTTHDGRADDDRAPKKIDVLPGMPPVTDPANLYSETSPEEHERGSAGRAQPRVRAEPRGQHGLGDRSRDDAGGRHAARPASTPSTSCRRGT